MDSFPPHNYIPAESQHAGITLFKPRPEKVKHEEVVIHKCVSCGGDMLFDAGEQDLKCQTCGKTSSTCPQCGSGMNYDSEQDRLACQGCGHTASRKNEAVGTLAETLEFREKFLEEAAQGWEQSAEKSNVKCAMHKLRLLQMR